MNNGVREDDNGGDFDAAANYDSNMFGKWKDWKLCFCFLLTSQNLENKSILRVLFFDF